MSFLRMPILPDFCNLGTWLRVLLAVNGMALAAAFARNPRALAGELTEMAALVEPVTIGSLVLLCAGRRWLALLDARLAAAAVVGVALFATALFGFLLAPLELDGHSTGRSLLWAALAALLLLAWFDLRARAHAPALSEARLSALTARIRPHFLFNSLNAVLGVIRSDPKRAEAALEELAELFRALMKDNRDLAPLSDEIALTRQYLELERLRLGERLQVRWEVESCPPDAIVPPLMLQPLVENAVYHGIEPLEGFGEIRIRLAGQKDRLTVEVSNPRGAQDAHHAGNHMALANIRERLSLFFDLEAALVTEARDGRYVVRIEMPCRQK
ncbi:MAG: histidine kinase [Rhodocyclaceae bacterium]|nr:histidine kinase [Rhodocyclaceae bacterium]